MTDRGAIVLCGGQSTRMGWPKAMLPFGPEQMLQRVVRLVGEVVERVVVVAAAGQVLPPLPDKVLLVHDRRQARGPLEGLSTGLRALVGKVDAAYATGCDVPLLVPDFARHLFELLEDHDIVVPRDGKYHHPLSAVYRVPVYQHAERLLEADRARPFFLFQETDTLEVPVDQLRQLDPDLRTLENLNRPEDYLAALERAGFEPPAGILEAWSGEEGSAQE